MDIWCRVTSQGLIPKYGSDHEEKQRLRVGEDVLCTISQPRNYEFHKKFWALLRLTVDNMPELTQRMHNIWSAEDMLDALSLDLGYFTTVWHGGKPLFKRKSISFAAMSQDAFELFYSRCIDHIIGKYLRGTNREDLIESIEEFK